MGAKSGMRILSGFRGCFKRGWAFALFALASASLGADPTQHPKRLVNGYVVDLAPLFKWWAKHEGSRPLSSWVHINGTILGTNAAGWILEAQVEGSEKTGSLHDPLKIILKNPPVEDFADFQSLSSKLAGLNARRTTLVDQAKEDQTHARAVVEQQRGARGAHARVLAMENRRLKKDENEAKADQKPLDLQIQELKSKLAARGEGSHYKIDSFALDLQSDYEQMPVYDHGGLMK
jgi:hypothetical protein